MRAHKVEQQKEKAAQRAAERAQEQALELVGQDTASGHLKP